MTTAPVKNLPNIISSIIVLIYETVKQHQTPSFEDFLYFSKKNNDWLPVDGPSLKYGEIIYKCLKSDGGIKEFNTGDMVCWDDESGVYVN